MRKVVLIILDGWGLAPAWGGNAIEMAQTPNMDILWRKYPHAILKAAEEAVGLPHHEPGNSEVGHLNIGSGQVAYQNLTGIGATITDGSFFKNPVLLGAFEYAQKNNSNLHLVGLVSDGGVHSSSEHLYALLKIAKAQKFERVFIHMITDGRDTEPMKALSYLAELEEKIKSIGVGRIVSVMGRYFAMDRDKRWERTERAYQVLTQGIGPVAETPEMAISENYRQNQLDEFIIPTVIQNKDQPFVSISHRDAVIFFNFRADRARQISAALAQTDFKNFERKKVAAPLYFATFAFLEEYTGKTEIKPVFQLREIHFPLSRVFADANLKQFHIAETEKYAHVTFFFGGGKETAYPNEKRLMIPSPKVATYDLKPEMSAPEVAEKTITEYNKYDFTICNFANADMVGHTGDIKATIRACETVDTLVGKLIKEILAANAVGVITADHGNAEQMLNPNTGEPYTEHTVNPVPLILCSNDENLNRPLRENGSHGLILSDIAPTILDIMTLKKPEEMTGESLVIH